MKKVILRVFNPKTSQESKNEYVVASTKSQNNLVEELQDKGNYVALLSAKEFYIDRNKALEFAKNLSSGMENEDQIAKAIIGALEVSCIVKREDK